MPDSNVYPVAVCKRTWWLDSKRKYPQLRVVRKQFPLAPQFAITAHVGQGQTLHEGVVADLCVGDNGNPFTAYVAFTRVTGREKLLIFRPFDAAPFQKGVGLGRELLLRHLRGTKIDWAALLAKYREERVCSGCSEKKPQPAYTAGQWKRLDRDRVCRECCQRHADAGRPWQCNRCKGWQRLPGETPQAPMQLLPRLFILRMFKAMLQLRARAAWSRVRVGGLESAKCQPTHLSELCCQGAWPLVMLRLSIEQRPVKDFSAWKEGRAHPQKGRQRCNDCLQEALVAAIAQRVHAKLARLRARIKKEQQAAKLSEKKGRHAAILAEIRALIAAQSPRTDSPDATATPDNHMPPQTTHATSPRSSTAALEPPQTTHAYTCPFCSRTVHSSVHTGQVDHRTQCGKKFRVQNGIVVGRMCHHQCPQCGATVQSTKTAGRIQIKHKTPQGRACSCQSWQV